jgi:hypothetical protein
MHTFRPTTTVEKLELTESDKSGKVRTGDERGRLFLVDEHTKASGAL